MYIGPSGHIRSAVNTTLTERRILQLKNRPLQPIEFISTLAKFEPIYREEEDAFMQWWVPSFCKRLLGPS
jgi:hypothetical protein